MSPSTAPGQIPVLEDTNDIGFQAVEVLDGFGIEPGVWFRLVLGGITGHRGFARDTGVIVKPAAAGKVADAIVRVFIDHGDRTNRRRRGSNTCSMPGVSRNISRRSRRNSDEARTRSGRKSIKPRLPFDRLAHIGVHEQKQKGLHWIGVVLPVGKITADQMRGVAKISNELGDGDIRLTVWQEPPYFRNSDEQSRAVGSRDRSAPALRPRRARSAPVWSPAPATRVAVSPLPTPRVMRS